MKNRKIFIEDLVYQHLDRSRWIIKYKRYYEYMGICSYKSSKKQLYCGIIYINKYLLKYGDIRDLKETVLHEIVHALLAEDNIPDNNHDEIFVKKCKELKCSHIKAENDVYYNYRLNIFFKKCVRICEFLHFKYFNIKDINNLYNKIYKK